MRKAVFLIAFFHAFLVSGSRVYAQESGVFLKLPLSPRAGGMGDASAALADDPMGLYYNPAGAAFLKLPVVSFVYQKYLQDIGGNSFGFVYPFKNWAIGVAPAFYKMKEEPVYDSLGLDTGEKFGYESKIIPVALAGRIGNLAVGLAGKSYSENIGGQASATTAYDVGAIYRSGRLSFGAAMQNLGGKIFDYDVVKVQRLGAAYTGNRYILAADLKKEGEDGSSLSAGAEFPLMNVLKIRGGWRFKDAFGGMTFGLGVEFGGLVFDYAFVTYGYLGDTHKAGISYRFGATGKKTETAMPVVKAVVNRAPELLWAGGENYAAAGISTGAGDTATLFVYRVKYMDADNKAPAGGYPKVHITKGGSEASGGPFTMEYVSGDNKTGTVYSHTRMLAPGDDYAYYFEALDSSGTTVTGAPAMSVNGPVVVPAEAVTISDEVNAAVAEFISKNVPQADAAAAAGLLKIKLANVKSFKLMRRNKMHTVRVSSETAAEPVGDLPLNWAECLRSSECVWARFLSFWRTIVSR